MTGPDEAGRPGAGPLVGAPRDPALAGRKARDGALALPLIGTLLLMPPVALVFAVDGRILGIPVSVIYVFVVWFLLVIGARRVGRRFLETATIEDGPGGRGR